jgi:general stress protein 26
MGMTGTPAGNETNSIEKLWDLIRHIKFAMFTTRHENGHLHSRPMTTQNAKGDEGDRLWFFMSRQSDPVSDLETEPTVNVSYSDPGADSYVSVSGTARVIEDRSRKQALWSKMTEAWFPRGIDDPDLALVEVEIVHAHYWDVKENKMTQLWKMAKAEISGNPPRDMGETGEVRMQ